MMLCTWVLSLLILILPACLHLSRARVLGNEQNNLLCSSLDNLDPRKHSSEVKVQDRAKEEMDYRLKALSLEAKFSDIPIPLGSEPMYDFFSQSPSDGMSIVFGYINNTESSELYCFFKTEFLRLGWNFIGGIQSIESMLSFEKPDRVCSISLRPLDGSTAIIIMVYPKNCELPV